MDKLFWAIALALTWWLWSGHTAILIIIFGVASIAITLYCAVRLDREADEHPPYRLGFSLLFYVPYILWEIWKANLDVARIIISPKMKISPRMIRVKASQKTVIGKVVYANSITLTHPHSRHHHHGCAR